MTEAASGFRRKHLIEYSRGDIAILDRPALEERCCSCYAAEIDRARRKT